MKSTPENQIKKELKQYLDRQKDLFYYSAVAGPYSVAGIPDIVGCHKGRFFGIEVKAYGRRGEKNRGCTALQVRRMEQIRAAGGFAMVFDVGLDDWMVLRGWIEGLDT